MDGENSEKLDRNQLDTYLAEYNSLRAEQLERVDFQNQAFNYLLIVLGAAISAVLALLGKSELYPIVFWIILLLPIICAQISFLFFDHELVIHSIGSYLYHHLRANIEDIVKSNGKILNNALEYKFLHKSSFNLHKRLSQSRWFLFLIPTVIPVIGLAIFTFLNWKWWNDFNPQPSKLIITICVFIWLVDLSITLLLIRAVIWTYVRIDTTDRSTFKIIWMDLKDKFKSGKKDDKPKEIVETSDDNNSSQ
jgi:hypothetical protein